MKYENTPRFAVKNRIKTLVGLVGTQANACVTTVNCDHHLHHRYHNIFVVGGRIFLFEGTKSEPSAHFHTNTLRKVLRRLEDFYLEQVYTA